MLRQPDADALLHAREADTQLFLRIATAKETQTALTAYATALSQRKAAARP